MDEEKMVQAEETAQKAEEQAAEKSEEPKTGTEEEMDSDIERLLENITTGKLTLKKPIRARSEDIKELKYDFGKLTGMDYTRAMNADRGNRDSMNPNSTQLLRLFAAAAEDRQAGYDAQDIANQIGINDVQVAIGIANNFFRLSLSAGARRISKKP